MQAEIRITSVAKVHPIGSRIKAILMLVELADKIIHSKRIVLLVTTKKRVKGINPMRIENKVRALNLEGCLKDGSMVKNRGGISETTIQCFYKLSLHVQSVKTSGFKIRRFKGPR